MPQTGPQHGQYPSIRHKDTKSWLVSVGALSGANGGGYLMQLRGSLNAVAVIGDTLAHGRRVWSTCTSRAALLHGVREMERMLPRVEAKQDLS
jgi:hypothetical protein